MTPAFSLLTNAEWRLMAEWEATPHRDGATGEPAIAVLQAFIEGCGLRRVVELGRNEGYGTLLLGFMLRRLGVSRDLISFDIDPRLTSRAQAWVTRAGLDEYVRLELRDSRSPESTMVAREYLDGPPQIVFIDTSHEYAQTLAELALWYDTLAPGGLILLHDSSALAQQYDTTGKGGVRSALQEWSAAVHVPFVNLNGDLTEWGMGVYPDGNGLAIIAKPVAA
jgi:predicted O-methyltransferase YrrM